MLWDAPSTPGDGISTLSLGPEPSGAWCRFLGRPGWRGEERQPRARSHGGGSIRLRTRAQLSPRTGVPLTEEAANTAYRLRATGREDAVITVAMPPEHLRLAARGVRTISSHGPIYAHAERPSVK